MGIRERGGMMNIQFEEEQEQIKSDGEKIALDKSCYNCGKEVWHHCEVWSAMVNMLGSQNMDMDGLVCALHERKE